jgi:hypothetical protein
VFLCGRQLSSALVLEIARLCDEAALATKLERAVERDVSVLALTLDDRRAILEAMGDSPPAGLEDLQATLRHELAWRRASGLMAPP